MSDTKVKSIVMNPGVMKDLTKYAAEGYWVDGNFIRFRNGRAEKIGGWVREQTVQAVTKNTAFSNAFSNSFNYSPTSFSNAFSTAFFKNQNYLFTGIPRAIKTWASLDGNKFLASGSEKKLEIFFQNKIFDITPVRVSVSLNNAITTVTGSSIVTITSASHNLTVGDYIDIKNQMTPINSISLTGQNIVKAVIDNNNYQIDAGGYASGSSTGGGILTIDYLLPTGFADNGNLVGFGGGTWGTPGQNNGGWGNPRAGIGGQFLTQWSMDNWGEDLIACQRGGGLYRWIKANGETTRAINLANAPLKNNFVLVAEPSRYVVSFGCSIVSDGSFDPMVIRWSNQEDLTTWAPDATNTSGEYRLPKGNAIICAIQTKNEIVVFTDTDVYSMQYIGATDTTDVFQFIPIASGVSISSQNACIDINGVVYWLGQDNFYYYDGVVHTLPTTLKKYIFDHDGDGFFNFTQKEKTFCGLNRQFNEIWWFYPANGLRENSNYVKYNYLEQVWDYGVLTRTAWADHYVFQQPYAFDDTGKLFIHEQGYDDDGIPLSAFITTAYFDITDGDQLMFIDKVIPDIDLPVNNNVLISVITKKYPHPAASITVKGPFSFDDTRNKISLRARGRQAALTFAVESTGSFFEVGKIRVSLQPDGGR